MNVIPYIDQVDNVTVNELSKSQYIRLIDVFVLGPLMVYWASKKKLNQADKLILAGFGIATIVYNGKNWYQNYKGQING